ncbi:MAG: MFS transporter [Oxalobacteraceae bacterium]|jgi:MFS family permease|nr:MFS transporter [Oxalobacteraceae bacterium]
MPNTPSHPDLIDSAYAFRRLLTALAIMTLGSVGMYVVVVLLPEVQKEFGISRADAALPYTVLMISFGVGGIVMGRWADRIGVFKVLLIGATGNLIGFVWASQSPNIVSLALAHGLIGLLGGAASFAPLLADTALWWKKRRGIAVAICASGNYVAGTLWPPVMQYGIEHIGWRQSYLFLGCVCGLLIALLAVRMKPRPPMHDTSPSLHGAHETDRPFGLSMNQAQLLLCVAGLSCCVAMSMPQVHIVAYCSDLGFGAARGAEMLSLMLGFGIASRLISGVICDRIGGLRTLLLGSFLQGIALLLFLPFDGLVSLYVISAMFGLFQGGIVPSYAIIVREYFPAAEAGARVGSVLTATLFGMALGGWMSGKVFDLTGSYHAAFINGTLWNLLNFSIAAWLLWRTGGFRSRAKTV